MQPANEPKDAPATATNPVDDAPTRAGTPLLDAAIRRVADVTRQQRESPDASAIPATAADEKSTLVAQASPVVNSVGSRTSTPARPAVTTGSTESSGPAQATSGKEDGTLPETISARVDRDVSNSSPPTLLTATGGQASAEARVFVPPGEGGKQGGSSGSSPDRRETAVDPTENRSDPPAPIASPAPPSTPTAPKGGEKETEPPTPPDHPQDTGATAGSSATLDRDPLGITEMRLCRNIFGFGSFEPLNETTVKTGQRLWIYCEMTGMQYEPKDTAFVSRLASRIEIVAAGGGPVLWEHELGAAEDLCRRRRHDYYVNYRVDVPKSLTPGSYRLRLIQTDLVANRSTSSEIPLDVRP
jgi:hypothetical protein